MITIRDMVGDSLEDDFLSFDMSEIQSVLSVLQSTEAIDLAHTELLQQQSLRGADLLADYLCRIVKTVSHLESQLSSTKNSAALNYISPEGVKPTADMRKWYSESCEEIQPIQEKLARAKASKLLLEKKYDIMIKSHHHYKDIASGLRRSILSVSNGSDNYDDKSSSW